MAPFPPQSFRTVPCSSASRAWAFFRSVQDISLSLPSGARQGSAGGERRGAAAGPGHAGHGDGDAEQARELRHAQRPEPEAVEAEWLDDEPSDRVEPHVAEEERARPRESGRAPGGER